MQYRIALVSFYYLQLGCKHVIIIVVLVAIVADNQ